MVHPKIGLALGSGGARGFSHVGVIKVLENAGIPIDMIAGSSMGALVGALYGAGQEVEHMYQLAKTFKRKYYLDFTVPKMGFIQGNRIKEYIRLFTHNKGIEAFDIPVAIVATDLQTGEKVVLKEGLAADAVRASISIPGIFVPEKIGDRLLIDGGVADRVPVSVVKEMGADIVIAVDCANFQMNSDISSIYDVILQTIDIMQVEVVRRVEINADVMLRPDVAQYSSRAFTNITDIIKQGEVVAEAHLSEIKTCIAKWGTQNNEAE